MDEISAEEVARLLYEPRKIYAPDGTTFVVQFHNDATTAEQLFGELPHAWMGYTITGPNEEKKMWLANGDGEFVSDPTNEDVPHMWTTLAEIALHGWVELENRRRP